MPRQSLTHFTVQKYYTFFFVLTLPEQAERAPLGAVSPERKTLKKEEWTFLINYYFCKGINQYHSHHVKRGVKKHVMCLVCLIRNQFGLKPEAGGVSLSAD